MFRQGPQNLGGPVSVSVPPCNISLGGPDDTYLCFIVLYADDTYLCLSDKNLNDLQLAVNSELLKVDRWMR